MKLFMDILYGNKVLKSAQIEKNKILIGRTRGDVIIPHPDISPSHLSISIERNQLVLRDLNSQAGTLVSGIPVREDHVLKSGETISVGPFTLKFYVLKNSTRAQHKIPLYEKEEEPADMKTPPSGKEKKSIDERKEYSMSGNKIISFSNSFIPHSYRLRALE